MQKKSGRTRLSPQAGLASASSGAHVTSAIGMGESAGRVRARRSSIFTQTVIWVTGLVCMAFLLGAFAQAWSNSQLAQQVQVAQRQLDNVKSHDKALKQAAGHYQDPAVIENEARQQLGYTRPGEHPVVVVGSNDSQQQVSTHKTPVQHSDNYWQDWWNAFFGN